MCYIFPVASPIINSVKFGVFSYSSWHILILFTYLKCRRERVSNGCRSNIKIEEEGVLNQTSPVFFSV